ncbi:MAG TPA: hypothetical protein VF593_13325 [Chthoniobacteraceae bacterium]|jgi:hypothetical protein
MHHLPAAAEAGEAIGEDREVERASDGRWFHLGAFGSLGTACGITAFLIGMLGTFTVRVVGEMPVSELLLLAFAGMSVLWIALTGRSPAPIPAPRLLAIFMLAEFIALLGYVLSDFYRGSATADMLRGWSRMAFLALDLCCFAVLFGSGWKAFVLVQIGCVCAVVGPLINGPLFGDYWKFCFAAPVTILVALLVPRVFGYWTSVVAFFGLAALHHVMDFRSLSMMSAAAGLLLLVRAFPPLSRRIVLIGGIILGVALVPILHQKVVSQASVRGNRSNVERSAMVEAAWEGFTESPLIGHGSWFSRTDIFTRFKQIRSINATLLQAPGFDERDDKLMAIHSQILVSLAEGGIFGAAFFLIYGVMILWALWFVTIRRSWSPLTPLFLLTLLVAFWNFWMSPFSGVHRVEIAQAAALILCLWAERKEFPGIWRNV